MRILKYILPIMALLLMIPLASAQEDEAGFSFVLAENKSFDELIAEYGCPVGIRDANHQLELNADGLIVAGQSVFIPIDSELCEIDYAGEIEFFEWRAYAAEHSDYPQATWELAAFFQRCEDDISLLNPRWEYQGQMEVIRIPLDVPSCFGIFELEAGQTPHEMALEYNICENVIWYYNNPAIYEPSDTARPIYIPIGTPACYQDGQVLVLDYHPDINDSFYVAADIVYLDEGITLADYAIQESYCLTDIEQVNRGKTVSNPVYQEIYVPEAVRHCQRANVTGTVVEVARQYNVCLEALLDVNPYTDSWEVFTNTSVWIPSDTPACYDENGLRLGHNDRAVHQPNDEEWLFAIAQQYQVCMADLFEVNPLLDNYPRTKLPSIIFIPATPPCAYRNEDGLIEHLVREPEISNRNISQTYINIAYMYNVCPIDIVLANPHIVVGFPDELDNFAAYILRKPQIGEMLFIPTGKRPCYDFDVPLSGVGNYRDMWSGRYPQPIQYLCYAQEINPFVDYSGHEPAISPVPESPGTFCYDRRANPYIVLNNISYVLYPAFSDAYLFDLARCFGVDAYDIVPITDSDLAMETDYPQAWRYWGIPNPTLDCPLIGNDTEAALTWLRTNRQQQALGNLNEDGEYSVAYGDTLSSIGWRYGYLPEWIRAENNLPDNQIYVSQTLRLPSYPNFYQLATYAAAGLGGLLVFVGASFALRWRGSGRKAKKKNDE